MKKYRKILLPVLILLALPLLLLNRGPDTSTVEGREAVLNELPKGRDWHIAREQELEDYLVAAMISADGQAGLAVFEPEDKGQYGLQTTTVRDDDDIVIGHTIVNGTWYDLFWFNGAPVTAAEIICTVEGGQQPMRYQYGRISSEGADGAVEYFNEIICLPEPADNYQLDIVYYDAEGNIYE